MKPLFGLLSPAGARARLTVLIFHRVLREPDPLFPDEVDAARFDELLGWVKSWFNVLPLDTAIQQLVETGRVNLVGEQRVGLAQHAVEDQHGQARTRAGRGQQAEERFHGNGTGFFLAKRFFRYSGQ